MPLTPEDFPAFFRAIHGFEPFPWQSRLASHLAAGNRWPELLDLPTGSGKTAALDVAVFHLALCCHRPQQAALRIALVVDRRLVVDDAFERAKKIADKINGASDSDGVVCRVAHRLQMLAGDGESPLAFVRLRGGVPLEASWAHTPTQPTIICSTVDQLGSRLLFRGYGISDRMKPVHAGLLGTNSLVLLDEAHLAEPFRQTLDAVKSLGVATTQTALLSATPGVRQDDAFGLSSEDREHRLLQRRISASKPVEIKELKRGEESRIADEFADKAREIMGSVAGADAPVAVGVIVNRVALARVIYDRLASLGGDADAILLTGRSRPGDRDKLVSRLVPFKTGAQRNAPKSLFIVATQCLEVGVDMDLDGLVAQAAPLDSLRQRFGRLNRAGRDVPAAGAILACKEDIGKKSDDPVYGDRIRKTYEVLQIFAAQDAQGGNARQVDFGIHALQQSIDDAGIDVRDITAEHPDAPTVMPAYLHLWSQTAPIPRADPDISLFLHGSRRTIAGVSVVWRGDIGRADLDGESADLREILRLMPPRTSEAMSVPIWAARAWLDAPHPIQANISDAPEGEHKGGDEEWQNPGHRGNSRRAFCWSGPDDPRTRVVKSADLRVGDVVVVPAEYGGCDEFGWAPESMDAVADLADDAAAPYRGRRMVVRVARQMMESGPDSGGLWRRMAAVLGDEGLDGGGLRDAMMSALTAIGDDLGLHSGRNILQIRDLLVQMQHARGRICAYFPYARRTDGVVLVAENGINNPDDVAPDGVDAAPSTEDDAASCTSLRAVLLDDHSSRVADLAGQYASRLGLDAGRVADLRLAAFLHDAGKADPRFQTMLCGGDKWNRPHTDPLAKSGHAWSPASRQHAGLPRGWRHEALSVRMAMEHPRFEEAQDPGLVLWLIGTHHGLGRPFFGFADPDADQPLPLCLDADAWNLPAESPGPQSLAFDWNGMDWPSLFACLRSRYGIWHLAHLEAILRLADHRASEQERTP